MYQNYDDYDQPYRESETPNSFSKASFVMGIIALFTIWTGCFAIICGSLGVVFACLSHGRKKMSTNAKAGFGMSLGAVIAGICVIIYSFTIVLGSGYNLDTFIRKYYPQYYEESQDTEKEQETEEESSPGEQEPEQTSPYINNNSDSVQL